MKNIMKSGIYLILAVMCAAQLIGVVEWVYVTWSVICYIVLAVLMYMDR